MVGSGLQAGEHCTPSGATSLARRQAVRERLLPIRLEFLKERAFRSVRDETQSFKWLVRFAAAVEYIHQQAAEEESREHFRTLKTRYGLRYQDDSPTSPLYPILIKLSDGGDIEPSERTWLRSQGLYSPLAVPLANHIEAQARLTGNKWHLVTACSVWREAGQFEKALAATDWSAQGYTKLEAARLTTRGGALRDLGRLDEALKHGHQALTFPPERHYPHNLLGGCLL
jgi:hypothetical protein